MKPKTKKGAKTKQFNQSDSDSQIYGGDDANEEFEQQLGQGVINDDSQDEMAEDVQLDNEIEDDEAENESLFDDDGVIKAGKQDPQAKEASAKLDTALIKQKMDQIQKKRIQ